MKLVLSFYSGLRKVRILLLWNAYPHSVGIIFCAAFFHPVVWNPWDKKAKAMADFGDDEYKHMLCVEAAAIERPITLKPGEEWRGRQELSAVPSSYCSGQLDPRKVLQGSWKIQHSGLYFVQVHPENPNIWSYMWYWPLTSISNVLMHRVGLSWKSNV